MAQISTPIPPPNTATSTAASAMPGNAITTSRQRISVSSTALREVAASAPRRAPTTRASAVAPSPMARDQRAPYISRLRTSRPRLSCPIQCPADGAPVPPAGSCWSSGSCGARTGARTATTMTTPRKQTAILDCGGSRRRPRSRTPPGRESRSTSFARVTIRPPSNVG